MKTCIDICMNMKHVHACNIQYEDMHIYLDEARACMQYTV